MDADLGRMTREQLIAEVKRLRKGIREHRDRSEHELCWHHPALSGLLPEKTDPIPVVPEACSYPVGIPYDGRLRKSGAPSSLSKEIRRNKSSVWRNERVMGYVVGYVLPVPKKNLRTYRRMAEKAGKIWREHGALEYRECIGDDLKVKFGVPFPRSVKAKPGETVVFPWIVFQSRAHRNRVNAKVMKDPRITGMCDQKTMPFDVKRMAYGGFKVLVDRR